VLPLLLDGGGGGGLGVTLVPAAVALLTVIPDTVTTFTVMALWIALVKAVLLVNAAALLSTVLAAAVVVDNAMT